MQDGYQRPADQYDQRVQVVTYRFRPRIDDPRNGGVRSVTTGKTPRMTVLCKPDARIECKCGGYDRMRFNELTITVNDELEESWGRKYTS